MSADVQLVIPSIDCVVPLHITPHLSPPGQLLLIMNLEGAGERMRMAIDANKYTHAHIFSTSTGSLKKLRLCSFITGQIDSV